MKPLSLLWALPVGLTLIWLVGLDGWPAAFWPWRHQLLNLTGLLGLGGLALSLLLMLRLHRMEVWCGGFDRMLRLHRHSAMLASGALLLHWLLVEALKWAVSAGWLTRPLRRGPGAATPLLWPQLGNQLAEWGFYLLLLVMAASLLTLVRYHHFRRVHRLAPLVYLMGWVHGLCLLPRIGPLTPLGLTLILGGTLGALGAIYALSGQIGRNHRQQGRISALHPLDEQTLEIQIALPTPLAHYRPGQFAFFAFAPRRESHPFTLVSLSADGRELAIAVRALGDHTSWLQDHLKVGGEVTVTGPYGAFTLPGPDPALWIGAGIGIVPFVAWLDDLVRRGQTRPGTVLMQCAPNLRHAPYRQQLAHLCQQAGIEYRLHLECEAGRPDLAALGERQRAPVWFCGPEAMAKKLDQSLNVPLHRELFQFR